MNLTQEKDSDIYESNKEISQGLFIDEEELDKKVQLGLGEDLSS